MDGADWQMDGCYRVRKPGRGGLGRTSGLADATGAADYGILDGAVGADWGVLGRAWRGVRGGLGSLGRA